MNRLTECDPPDIYLYIISLEAALKDYFNNGAKSAVENNKNDKSFKGMAHLSLAALTQHGPLLS